MVCGLDMGLLYNDCPLEDLSDLLEEERVIVGKPAQVEEDVSQVVVDPGCVVEPQASLDHIACKFACGVEQAVSDKHDLVDLVTVAYK